MSLGNNVLELIKKCMPAGASVREANSLDGVVVMVSWTLDDDPDRPNKPSKTIAIHVSHEAIEDYAAAADRQREVALQRVSNFLAAKLAAFDPSNDTPRYSPPPVEKWVVSTSVIFG